MLSDRETLLKVVKVICRAYFDTGQFEVVARDDESATARAVDFVGDPVLCERITGVVEAHLRGSRAEHIACVFRGGPACEWKVWW